MKSKGLGDTIENFLKKTGIKAVVKAGSKLAGVKDCGCNKRKQVLNQVVPYKK